LAERLRKRRSDMKVLFVSDYAGDAVLHQRQLDRGAGFLAKPFTQKALDRKIREVLNGGEAARAAS